MPQLILSIAFLVLVFTGSSQQYVDLIRVEYDHAIPQNFEDTTGKGSFDELAIDIVLPIVVNEKLAIVTGALLEQSRVSLAPNSQTNLYGTMLKFGANIKHNKHWSGTYLFLPKFSSDLKRIRNRDIQFGGLALIKYQVNKAFNYRFGIYSNGELHAPLVVPFFGIYLLKNNWEIKAALPINAEINRQFARHFKIGARFDGINKSYYLNDGSKQYVEKVNNEIGLLAGAMFGNYHFQIFGGYAIGRSFRTYQYGDRFDLAISAIKINNERIIQNQDFKDGPVFRLSFTYRLPTSDIEKP
jgi:hypothetical protein